MAEGREVKLNDDVIEELTSYLDAKTVTTFLLLNRQFNRVARRTLHRIQPFHVQSVVLQTPCSIESLAGRLDPAPYLEPDPPGVVPAVNAFTPLYVKIYGIVHPLAKLIYHRNEDVYGSELELNYENSRSDKFVFMHPDSLEFSKKWPDEMKPHPEYQGYEEGTKWADLNMSMIPNERIRIRSAASGSRTILVFTPDSVASLGLRLIYYINQDLLKTFKIEKLCLSPSLLQWFSRMKCSVASASIKNCFYTAKSAQLTNLLNRWQPKFLDFFDFGFLSRKNPFTSDFWKSSGMMGVASIKFRCYQDPPVRHMPEPARSRDMDQRDLFFHPFGNNQIDLSKMSFHTLCLHVDNAHGFVVNRLLQAWKSGDRRLCHVSLRTMNAPFDAEDVLGGIGRGEWRNQFVLERNKEDKLWMTIGNSCEIRQKRLG